MKKHELQISIYPNPFLLIRRFGAEGVGSNFILTGYPQAYHDIMF